jgi:hypothetical protein
MAKPGWGKVRSNPTQAKRRLEWATQDFLEGGDSWVAYEALRRRMDRAAPYRALALEKG